MCLFSERRGSAVVGLVSGLHSQAEFSHCCQKRKCPPVTVVEDLKAPTAVATFRFYWRMEQWKDVVFCGSVLICGSSFFFYFFFIFSEHAVPNSHLLLTISARNTNKC